MLRLSESLAKELLRKMKTPEIELSGENIFLPKNLNGVGVVDPVCAIGTDFHFILEVPIPLFYPDLPFIPVSIPGYFLYKKEELLRPMEQWLITEALINPLAKDYESQIDVSDCSIIINSDIDKLTCKTIATMEQLIKNYPTILDCLDLKKK